ncbi:MAG: hypothetical protein GF401_02020 [Chitinivibrionales bacterium]|nr:hypothetical protein [Chitinivibrionales bacterium]
MSPLGAFTVSDVDSNALIVDTSDGNLFGEGSVGDPYIGVYPIDTIIVKGGAKVHTKGLFFYDEITGGGRN